MGKVWLGTMKKKTPSSTSTQQTHQPLSQEKWLESASAHPTGSFKERWIKPFTRAIPKSWRRRLRYWLGYPAYFLKLTSNSLYDFNRFNRWSSADGKQSLKEHYRAWIIADYHKIEKALAFSNPRTGFGKVVLIRLIEHADFYVHQYGADETILAAADVLLSYQEFHDSKQAAPAVAGLPEKASQWKERGQDASVENCRTGGVIECTREQIHARGKMDLSQFFFSRHSIRQYAPEEIDPACVDEAVRMAQRTPSVCNRQSPKVYVYLDPKERQQVIQCQKGNAGFGDQATGVLVVTADTRAYFSVGERYQPWIDGGMFAMSLVYALHSLGIGSCCLNWSVEKAADRNLRKVTNIPDSECVIMMISIGHLPDKFVVAQSHRKPLDKVRIRGLRKQSS